MWWLMNGPLYGASSLETLVPNSWLVSVEDRFFVNDRRRSRQEWVYFRKSRRFWDRKWLIEEGICTLKPTDSCWLNPPWEFIKIFMTIWNTWIRHMLPKLSEYWICQEEYFVCKVTNLFYFHFTDRWYINHSHHWTDFAMNLLVCEKQGCKLWCHQK